MITYPSILVLHSEDEERESLHLFLQEAGAKQVTLCTWPDEAEKLLSQNAHGLLLVQYRLEEGTGLDFLRSVRERGVQTPAILLSFNPDKRVVIETLTMPHTEFLKLPFTLEEWEKTVTFLLQPPAAS